MPTEKYPRDQRTARNQAPWTRRCHSFFPGSEKLFGHWSAIWETVGARLIILLVAAMAVTFALLGYLNIRLHRKHLEAATLQSAERISGVMKRATSYHMMRNDRGGLYNTITTMANEPGVVRLRIIDQEGHISFSTDPKEVNRFVDKSAESCYACHAQAQPLTKLNRPDRLRIFRSDGSRAFWPSLRRSRTSRRAPTPPATRIPKASRFSASSTPTFLSPLRTRAWRKAAATCWPTRCWRSR